MRQSVPPPTVTLEWTAQQDLDRQLIRRIRDRYRSTHPDVDWQRVLMLCRERWEAQLHPDDAIAETAALAECRAGDLRNFLQAAQLVRKAPISE
jgi:hypothetical protein